MTLFHTPKGMYRNQMWASTGKRMFGVNTYQVYSQSMGWCVPTFTAAFQGSFSLLCTEGLLCYLKLRHFAIQFVILEPWPVIQRYANNVQFCASLHTCNASQLLELPSRFVDQNLIPMLVCERKKGSFPCGLVSAPCHCYLAVQVTNAAQEALE